MHGLFDLFDVEWLFDVIIGSGFETTLDVELARLSTHEDEWNVLEVVVLLEKFRELETIDPRKTYVQNNEINRIVVEDSRELSAIGRRLDEHAVALENSLESVSHRLVIFDDQDRFRRLFVLEVAERMQIDDTVGRHPFLGDLLDFFDEVIRIDPGL